MNDRYEIVLDKDMWYQDQYIGPWSGGRSVTFYDDFKEALELVFEWGLNSKGEPRKHNKIGIYDHEDDTFYTQEYCFKLEDLMYANL